MKFSSLFFALAVAIASCTNGDQQKPSVTNDSSTHDKTNTMHHAIKEEAVSYQSGNNMLNGYIAYDSAASGKRPIVLVVPEWWGLTEYPKMRARQLAELGYFAMAVDIYGEGKTAGNPDDALKMATPFYKNPQEAFARINAALAKAKSYEQADTSKTAAIGYCFGGSMVLNAAKLGGDFDGVVSFHGGLEGVPANKDLLKAKILVCHGGADSFVPQAQVEAFRRGLDSIGADYTFKVYDGATHAFTNPEADSNAAKFKMPIKYDAVADTASWNDMKAFFKTIF